MKRFDLWKLSMLNVFAAPVRSMLTVLGFAIGVASILAVLTLGDAGRREVQKEMTRLGIDKVWLSAENNSALPMGSGHWLAELTGTAAEELIYCPVIAEAENGRSMSVAAIGCEASYLSNLALQNGERMRAAEWRKEAGILLLGEKTAKALNVWTGDYVSVSSNLFEIGGIVRAAEGVASTAFEDAIFLPADFLTMYSGGMIHEIQLTTSKNAALQNVQKQAVDLMSTQGYQVNAVTMQVQIEAAESVMFTFVNVLKWIAVICIMVGGVGVMNILLVSVRERKREIGVMKSMGTTPFLICVLFLLEALIYAVMGALLGILLGEILCYAAGKSIQLRADIRLSDAAAVFLSALFTGFCFGVLPALKASMLKCVDALRQE